MIEREREREIVCICMCVFVYLCMCVRACVLGYTHIRLQQGRRTLEGHIHILTQTHTSGGHAQAQNDKL